jgi:CubicO group peptidase (beta-lactamase class C family)
MDLPGLIAEHDVPGAQVAVLAGGEVQNFAAGVLSLRTRVETTTDSVFKIGSITKLWTATLVQHLVLEGLLDLDRPVSTYLPGFRLSSPDATGSVTARRLLTHTSGIAPYHFIPAAGVEEFVAALADEEHPLRPGAVFSYSNSGFVVLGRVVEVLRGKPFHDVLRDDLATPLGLATVATDVYEAILHRAAVGHVGTEPTKKWAGSYSTAPSGSHLAMSAHDLLTFVRLHLTDPALAPLREPQLDVPDYGEGVIGWGLGWMRYPGGIVGHTGVSKGQKAFLRVDPAAGVAVAVLTNSTNGEPLAHDVFTANGMEMAPPPVPPADPAPIDRWMCGTYRNPLYDITLDGTSLTYRARNGNRPDNRVEVVRLGERTIITADDHRVMSLIGSDDRGRAEYLHNGAAAYRIA